MTNDLVMDDTLTKVSTEAASDLVKSFYVALQSNRQSIATYYSATPTTILFNGNQVADGPAVQEIFVNQMPTAKYEVQSYDAQIINRAYPTPTADGGTKPTSEMGIKDMSLLVLVSGFVTYGDGPDLPQRAFSESFVMIPNPTASDRGKHRKDWLIQSHNFRLVV
ncbi:hypothetical protein N7532_009409 [Penicillium argentinense]|uniref:NTF2 domain-containing protein n=1 Tax=Penicillium argentinense TaxID=1131581 RepID=A0A9W9EZC4_9EURO|nr:uncharacterized protein N7532_009409 [Penicillium argentinense]KAJ5090725.1 hypothetical protein N7532_009409 [Penicillium argentinense]